MKKLYAIVSPAYSKVGDSFVDLPAFFVSPFHKIIYEHVCDYSLGQNIQFFETIEEAKKQLEDGVKGSKQASKMAVQKAVLELDANDEGQITGFSKLHTVDAQKLYEQTETDRLFKAVRIPVWKEKTINPAQDVTEGALEELNARYQESKKPVAQASL